MVVENYGNSFPKAFLDSVSGNANYKVVVESIHEENTEDAILRRFKDKWLFLVTLILIISAFSGLILFVIFYPNSPHINIVISSAMSLVMALAGYYVGGKKQ